jgi:small subunit ribosomal protein S10e
MQSFTSKELVKEIFSWRYYYWYLTDEGIEYLREYLNLSAVSCPTR